MNGNGAMPQIELSNPIVEMIERLLADAKAGRISSIGIVAVTPQAQVAAFPVGMQIGDIYLGAGLLQKRILHQIDPPLGEKKPTIIRAAPLG
jgi:hypothetical protein